MSILKKNISAARIVALATRDERLFHISDLSSLWDITDRNLLRITVNRYVKSGLLYQVYRGFYSLIPVKNLDPLLLGMKAIHGYCYLSVQSILFRAGYVSRKIHAHTFVAAKSRRLDIAGHHFICRQLSGKFLYNPEGVEMMDGVYQATVERSIADMLYFNPKFDFDHPVDWLKIRALQKKIGYPLTPKRYDDTKGK